MKITCNVIKDLAELYVGDVLSEDSKLIVEEHIAGCDKCKEYIKVTKRAFEDPPAINYEKVAEEKAKIESLRDKIVSKVLPVIMVTVFVLTIAFVSTNYVLFEHEIVLPYDGELIYATEDGLLHFPDCYDVAFTESGSSEFLRVQVHTHYIDKLKGVETDDECVVDMKEFVVGRQKTQIIYRDGVSEQVIWENK